MEIDELGVYQQSVYLKETNCESNILSPLLLDAVSNDDGTNGPPQAGPGGFGVWAKGMNQSDTLGLQAFPLSRTGSCGITHIQYAFMM